MKLRFVGAALATTLLMVLNPQESVLAEDAQFSNPQVNGVVVDHCLNWGSNCDQPAADRFCQDQGYARASHYAVFSHAPTFVQGDSKICENQWCVGFSQVTCTRRTENRKPPSDGRSGPPPVKGALSFSKWTSITPDQRQFAAQPGRTIPLAVLGDGPAFKAGDYLVFVANSSPEGLSIARWEAHGPYTLIGGDRWRATLLPMAGLAMDQNTGDLNRYSSPGPRHAMIYAKNFSTTHWQSICVLPVGSGMQVNPDCFGGSGNVVYVPDDTDNTDLPCSLRGIWRYPGDGSRFNVQESAGGMSWTLVDEPSGRTEIGNGTVDADGRISMSWSGTKHGSGRANGRLNCPGSGGKADSISWSNGAQWLRDSSDQGDDQD